MRTKIGLMLTGLILIASLNTFSIPNFFREQIQINNQNFNPVTENIEIACYWYYDNKWQGGIIIVDCLNCLLVPVDNPRYPGHCNPGVGW